MIGDKLRCCICLEPSRMLKKGHLYCLSCNQVKQRLLADKINAQMRKAAKHKELKANIEKALRTRKCLLCAKDVVVNNRSIVCQDCSHFIGEL